MPRMKVCSCVGCSAHEGSCPTLTEATGKGRCPLCVSQANRARGSYATRGGGGASAWRRARAACLRRDPLCVCRDTDHGHAMPCGVIANTADHFPIDKASLVAAGVRNPDALERLRGLCTSCHSKHTARTQPGGWNRRD